MRKGIMKSKDQICSICGKRFLIDYKANYIFKVKFRNKYSYQCSYTCYSKAVEQKEIIKNGGIK